MRKYKGVRYRILSNFSNSKKYVAYLFWNGVRTRYEEYRKDDLIAKIKSAIDEVK